MKLHCSRAGLLSCMTLLALLASKRAGAAASSSESEAERLFREGRQLLVAGRFAEACPKLEQSQRQEPRLGTLLNFAFCQQRLGNLATAWRGFREATDTARAARDGAREKFAREQAAALQPRVPWLRLRASAEGAASAGADAPRVSLDGQPLAPAALEQELALDPGEHSVSASRGGTEYWRTTLTLRESEHATLIIPAPPPAPAPSSEPSPTLSPPRTYVTSRRLVYELGAFVGFSFIATQVSTPAESLDRLQGVRSDGGATDETWTCASASCDYLPFDSGGFPLGVMGFVGYPLTEGTHLGVRFLGGLLATGGGLLALGPTASFQLGEHWRVGPSLLLGAGSHANDGLVALSTPSGDQLGSEGRLNATLGIALGVGAELSVDLLRTPTGSLTLQTLPLFLYGSNGTALCLPLGLAYRWQ